MKAPVGMQAGVLLLSIAALAASAPQTARACAYHGTPDAGYAMARPHAMYVELATHQAMQSGSLAQPAAVPSALGALRVNRWLRELAGALHAASKKAGAAPNASFALLIADAGLWSRYRIDRETEHVDIHVPGPADERVVVITGEAVLAALTSGQITAAQAVHQGLVAIVGQDDDAARVTQLWIAAL